MTNTADMGAAVPDGPGADQRDPPADQRLGDPVGDAPADLQRLTVITRVNGVEKQRGVASDMVFSIPAILSYFSHVMTLEPGDLVATGTPAGVAPLTPGDIVEVEILGISKISNGVKADR